MMSESELVGGWRMITITKTGRNLRFYLNGQPYSKTYNSNFECISYGWGVFGDEGAQKGAVTRIGSWYNCSNNQTNFNGLIDEFRIYNYPMPDSQVEELFKR